MAIRPLIFGLLFVAAFVLTITSILWVDPNEPARPLPDANVSPTPTIPQRP
ncbi:hypothetical protein [Rhizobium sp. BK251]|uniref:hypothetical protein n=1 Tax=Rhizobium sp. BK251 TaxID=2512125 RepID=UPI0010D70EA9|nr:hypothetical protein [Rhizobium sp. BK251]TCL70511.1 hypothetical protein EV286_107385 [Rhizobium sp. BK251]